MMLQEWVEETREPKPLMLGNLENGEMFQKCTVFCLLVKMG